MPGAWRIVKRKHAATAFDGEGARKFGGRWNSSGTAVVYCSESLALAALELLVRLESSEILEAYVTFSVAFPESMVTGLDPRRLPRNWRAYPPPPALQRLGDDWAEKATSAVLRVPSVLVDEEYNYLIHPAHPDFKRIKIGEAQPFKFDSRFARG